MFDFVNEPMRGLKNSSSPNGDATNQKIYFKSNGFLTLGVEIEVQLIDPKTFDLSSCAEDILQATEGLYKVKPEFYLSTLEINTDKQRNVQAIEKDLNNTLLELQRRTKDKEILFSSTGAHPFSMYQNWHISPAARYQNIIDKAKWITQRMCVFGMHIHLGMLNGDTCIEYQNFFSFFLPHLLALSASSPFWQGIDTGLASSRPSVYESLPTAGQCYPAKDWQEFETLCDALMRCNAISSVKDLWWDMRPSPEFGTLEIRVCDGIATLSETLALCAFIHTLAHWFEDNKHTIDLSFVPWIARENKWRAMRFGLEAELVLNESGETRPLKQSVFEWLDKLEPYVKKLNYDSYFDSFKSIMTHGNSSSRQKIVFARTGSLKEVVSYNVKEFLSQSPLLSIK